MKYPLSHESRLAIALLGYFASVFLLLEALGSITGMASVAWWGALASTFIVSQGLFSTSFLRKRLEVDVQNVPEGLKRQFERICTAAHIPAPRFGISSLPVANAFAFGRTKRDATVCITGELQEALDDDELAAVLAHEVSHLKHWDTTVISFLTVAPMLADQLLRFAFVVFARVSTLGWWTIVLRPFVLLFGMVLALFFLTVLPLRLLAAMAVFYGSRVCEMNADLEATRLGVPPLALASALFRLARRDEHAGLSGAAGALLVSNPADDNSERRLLNHLDPSRSGRIDEERFLLLKDHRIGVGDHIVEIFRSHPILIRRLRQLAREASADTRG